MSNKRESLSAEQTGRRNNYSRRQYVCFAQVAAVALQRAEKLVPVWLPRGWRRGHEWVAINPTRADAHAGSFSVNLRTGRWGDFAVGAAGGDLISLRAYLDGSGQLEAARKLHQELAQ